MKKTVLLISAILISALVASAQTPRKVESARRVTEGAKRISHTGGRVVKLVNGIVRVGPSTTFLRNGLGEDEVLRLLGRPAYATVRREGDLRLATYTFQRAEGRILVAEFHNGVLVNSHIEDRERIAQR